MTAPLAGFFETSEWEEEYLAKQLGEKVESRFSRKILSPQDLKALSSVEVLSPFVYSRINREVFEALPGLKLVATRSTGYDHIDLEAAQSHGVVVSTVPHYAEHTVAEHTFALILSLSRNVHKAYLRTIRGNFSLQGLEGFDLKGRTIGVVGAGHIGMHVIKMAVGFGMNALAYDVRPNEFLADFLRFRYVSFEELLGASDVITLHAPLTSETHHLINQKSIRFIKRGAILINTARGQLVETRALVEALDAGIISAAGLDVLGEEEAIRNEEELLRENRRVDEEMLRNLLYAHTLMNRENVVITPHIAFDSREARLRIVETTARNILSFLAGNPENVVASPRG